MKKVIALILLFLGTYNITFAGAADDPLDPLPGFYSIHVYDMNGLEDGCKMKVTVIGDFYTNDKGELECHGTVTVEFEGPCHFYTNVKIQIPFIDTPFDNPIFDNDELYNTLNSEQMLLIEQSINDFTLNFM